MKIQAPISVELKVGFTDGKRAGIVTVSLGNGFFPTEGEMREAIANVEKGKDLPEGFRLMTKREWWDHLCAEEFGQRFALPGGEEFDK